MNRKPGSVSVYLVDNHPVFLAGLCTCWQTHSDIEVAGRANSFVQAESQIRRMRPNVVVMELALPHMNGLEATERLLQIQPDIRVLLCSDHVSTDYLQQAKQAGASGFVPKTCSAHQLKSAVKTVSRGGYIFSKRPQPAKAPVIEPDCSITKREKETLTLLATGLTSKEIAVKLHLSPRTVEWYKKNLMQKTKARNVAALCQFAYRHGLTVPGAVATARKSL